MAGPSPSTGPDSQEARTVCRVNVPRKPSGSYLALLDLILEVMDSISAAFYWVEANQEISSDFKDKRIRSHNSGRRRVKVKWCKMGENVAAIFGKYNLPLGRKHQFTPSPLIL